MKKNFLAPVAATIFLSLFFLPIFAHSAGLVPCNGVDEMGNTTCGFKEILTLISILIKFIFFNLAIPIFALLFAYAGVIFLTAGGNAEKVTQAKSIFGYAIVGFLLGLGAWLILKLVFLGLGFKDTEFKTFFN